MSSRPVSYTHLLRKVGDHYVIVYASEFIDETHRNGGHPTNLDYAVSKSCLLYTSRCV